MAEFNPNPFKGEASIPHVSEDAFNAIFIGFQGALAVIMFPGKILGIHPQANRINRDYAIACVNEAAAASAARAGRVPTQALPKPRLTDSSWRSMFDRHVRWKAWTVDRLGGGYTPRG